MFLGFQLQVWYFIENIVFQAPVCIIWDFFEPLRTVIDHFRTLWSNFVHFCLFWTQCDLERHRKMNSKILFSLLGLFYGMSRGAFRGVSFFCKFDMWTSFTNVHTPVAECPGLWILIRHDGVRIEPWLPAGDGSPT